jgi:hypothetical protein
MLSEDVDMSVILGEETPFLPIQDPTFRATLRLTGVDYTRSNNPKTKTTRNLFVNFEVIECNGDELEAGDSCKKLVKIKPGSDGHAYQIREAVTILSTLLPDLDRKAIAAAFVATNDVDAVNELCAEIEEGMEIAVKCVPQKGDTGYQRHVFKRVSAHPVEEARHMAADPVAVVPAAEVDAPARKSRRVTPK